LVEDAIGENCRGIVRITGVVKWSICDHGQVLGVENVGIWVDKKEDERRLRAGSGRTIKNRRDYPEEEEERCRYIQFRPPLSERH